MPRADLAVAAGSGHPPVVPNVGLPTRPQREESTPGGGAPDGRRFPRHTPAIWPAPHVRLKGDLNLTVSRRRPVVPNLDPHDRPGRRMIGGALAFLRSATLLLEFDPQALAWATMFVQLAFAIELGLKAYLREEGLSEKDQFYLRHDLVKAFELAVAAGFKPRHPAVEMLIRELNPHHKDMSLRYLTGTSVDLPKIEDSIVVVGWLLQDLHEQGSFRKVG